MSRHRRFQIAITLGVTGTTIVVVFWPEYQVHAAGLGLITNMIWVWE